MLRFCWKDVLLPKFGWKVTICNLLRWQSDRLGLFMFVHLVPWQRVGMLLLMMYVGFLADLNRMRTLIHGLLLSYFLCLMLLLPFFNTITMKALLSILTIELFLNLNLLLLLKRKLFSVSSATREVFWVQLPASLRPERTLEQPPHWKCDLPHRQQQSQHLVAICPWCVCVCVCVITVKKTQTWSVCSLFASILIYLYVCVSVKNMFP